MPQHRTHTAGFSMIELMITVAVFALLLGLASPSFTNVIRTNRIAAQTNSLVGALNYARVETTVRGMPISICAATPPASDGTSSCVAPNNANTDWASGWLVFTDRAGLAGVLDSTDELLQASGPIATGFQMTANASFARFNVGVAAPAAIRFDIRPTLASVCSITQRRDVRIGNAGRVTSSKVAC